MKITFIRHTHVDIPEMTVYGQTDVPVASTFEEEAAATLANLKALGHKFDKAYTSPLQRAMKLADYCGYGDAERDDRLKEIFLGDWEMARLDKVGPENMKTWKENFALIAPPGGEKATDMAKRVVGFLEELKTKPYSNVAIFCHGGVIMVAGAWAGLYPLEKAFEHLVDNGGIMEIVI